MNTQLLPASTNPIFKSPTMPDLRCPACLCKELQYLCDAVHQQHLYCHACGGTYPLINDIPLLFDRRALLQMPRERLAVWHLTQKRSEPEYKKNDVGSCSLATRSDVQQFRDFMQLRDLDILDIGSGAFHLPGYVEGTKYRTYVGLDPLIPDESPDFALVSGLAEQLPFANQSFDVVILATSLDHCIDIRTTAKEVRRVLRPEGSVYVWEALFIGDHWLGKQYAEPFLIRHSFPLQPAAEVQSVLPDLALAKNYQTTLEQLEADSQSFRELLVDEFHFQHLTRSFYEDTFTQAGYQVAAEFIYVPAGQNGPWEGVFTQFKLAQQTIEKPHLDTDSTHGITNEPAATPSATLINGVTHATETPSLTSQSNVSANDAEVSALRQQAEQLQAQLTELSAQLAQFQTDLSLMGTNVQSTITTLRTESQAEATLLRNKLVEQSTYVQQELPLYSNEIKLLQSAMAQWQSAIALLRNETTQLQLNTAEISVDVKAAAQYLPQAEIKFARLRGVERLGQLFGLAFQIIPDYLAQRRSRKLLSVAANSPYDWVRDFVHKFQRAPRILHIGNIANNAYYNAKLMRAVGVDSDVIVYDSYYIMGCPEWEDADLSQPPADQLWPDWTSVDLKGFRRPAWFAQGPLRVCQQFLEAKYTKGFFSQWVWRNYLDAYRFFRGTKKGQALMSSLADFQSTAPSTIQRLKKIRDFCRNHQLRDYPGVFWLFLEAQLFDDPSLYQLDQLPPPTLAENAEFEAALKELIAELKAKYPTVDFTIEDFASYRWVYSQWKTLFTHYDIVLGYSTDGFLPRLVGKPYFAFEHGTVREAFAERMNNQSFELGDTFTSKLTLGAFSAAECLFLTNHDLHERVKTLVGNQYATINHPYDEDHGIKIKKVRPLRKQLLRELDSDFLLFMPAQLTFKIKGNDRMLRAFGELRKRGHRVGLVITEWGQDLEAAKAILTSLGCLPYTRWIAPVAAIEFDRLCKAADVVIDQFLIGSMGGVAFKSLAVGAPLCTYLNENMMTISYTECPPVLNCQTEDDIIEQLGSAIRDQLFLKELGKSGRNWIKKYHSANETITVQMKSFDKYVRRKILTNETA